MPVESQSAEHALSRFFFSYLVVGMGYLLVAIVSFFIGYALCFSWFKRDIIEGKPIVFKNGVYVATKKKIEP